VQDRINYIITGQKSAGGQGERWGKGESGEGGGDIPTREKQVLQ
jgi:hypothetical protein